MRLCMRSYFVVDRLVVWRSGGPDIVCRINKVTLRRAQLALGLVSHLWQVIISICNHLTRSSQPCISSGSLNRVPALAC